MFDFLFLYLDKVTQLRRKDEDIRCKWHLTVAVELLIVNVYIFHRWVEWVEAGTSKQFINYIISLVLLES